MERSLQELLDSYDSTLPLREASTIPAEWYVDPRIADLERQNVFGRTWQVVGRAEQVAKPGQFITTDIAGEPILVIRAKDGVLRAFFNVCRHHAAAVVTEPCGHATVLRCPYHGWSYATDGTLQAIPEFEDVSNFEKSQNGLVPIKAETWEKFVFVNLDSEAKPLRDFLGTFVKRMAPLELGNLHFFESRAYTLNCNWKVFVDNYLDGGYHVPHLHKGLNSVLQYSQYKIEEEENYCVQSSPMRTASEDAAVASTRQGDNTYYLWLYPNFMINWYEGIMDTNLVLPIDTDRTRVIFDFYFANVDEANAARNRQSVDVSERIQNEDVGICESVQRGLKSRAYGAGRLSVRREAGEQLFHRLLYSDLKKGLGRRLAAR
jgi:phenylpropionate dioxygenase-like ring-hydroxylating dioxygenase large terminal subunit